MSFGDLVLLILSRLNPTPFIMGWIETRPWRLLLAAIPVLGAITAGVALRASMTDVSGDAELRHYLHSASEALKRGDEDGAELRFRRAALIAPTDPRPKFGLATIAEKEGDLPRAISMMEELAASTGDVAVQANRWLIAKTETNKLDAEGRKTLIRRLERAVEFEPQSVDVRVTLAEMYRQAGFPKNAATHLRVVAESNPMHRIMVVRLLLDAGDKAAALKEAADAERLFRERLQKNPSDLNSRAWCASVLALQGKHGDAIQVLQEGATLNDPVLIRKAISLFSINWAKELRQANQDPRRVLELTSAALKADPSNTAALLMLTDLASDSATGDDAVAKLKESLAAGEAPWLIHMALGTRLLGQGNLSEGAEHLEQAVKLNPSAAIALNNLAWTLSTQDPPDLERGQSLAEQAVTLAPGNPQIRETRGQIYLKKGRWKDALADLEAVLPVYSQQPALKKQLPHVHRSLAKAYEELGNKEMMKLHLERARGADGDDAPEKAKEPAPEKQQEPEKK